MGIKEDTVFEVLSPVPGTHAQMALSSTTIVATAAAVTAMVTLASCTSYQSLMACGFLSNTCSEVGTAGRYRRIPEP